MRASSADRPKGERTVIAILLTIAGLALALRATSIAQPLGIDQSLWASAVRGMARGQLLYQDVWEQRPPGIYLTYLAAFAIAGWREATIAWLDLAAATVTTIAIFGVTRTLASPKTAALASALYAAFTMPSWLYGYGGFLERSISETFTVPLVVLGAWAAATLVRGSGTASVQLTLVGLATGLAVVFKPNAALYGPALALWLVFYWCLPRHQGTRAIARMFVHVGVAAAVPTVVMLAWLWSVGVIDDARVAVIDFNRFYVSEGVTLPALARAFAGRVYSYVKTDPLWAAGAVGAFVALMTFARQRRLSPIAGLVVIWGAAAALVILVNGIRLYNSYFFNAFAPLAIMSAWVMTADQDSRRWRRGLSIAVGLLMAVMAVSRGYVQRVGTQAAADLSVLTGRVDRATYLERFGGYATGRGYSARANLELADYIRAHTSPDDRIFLFGINGAGVYFLADRLPAHRFLRANFFVPETFPDPAFTRAAVIADLRRVTPLYVIFERLHTTADPAVAREIDALPEHPEVRGWLGGYSLETTIEDFKVYRRRD